VRHREGAHLRDSRRAAQGGRGSVAQSWTRVRRRRAARRPGQARHRARHDWTAAATRLAAALAPGSEHLRRASRL